MSQGQTLGNGSWEGEEGNGAAVCMAERKLVVDE